LHAESQGGAWTDPSEPHGEGFLVGRISAVVRSKERQENNRYLIQISEYARVKIPAAWKGERNPVRYGTLEDLGIDPTKLSFETMPDPSTLDAVAAAKEVPRPEPTDMKGETGWFSSQSPTIDRHPATLTINDDGTVTISVVHSGQGQWIINLQNEPRWSVLTGDASCRGRMATVTWAFMKEYAPRKWRLSGEWIEDGESYHWWADLIETVACRGRLGTLTRDTGNESNAIVQPRAAATLRRGKFRRPVLGAVKGARPLTTARGEQLL